MDISLNEYTMHYICHTEIQLGGPYMSIKKKIVDQLKQFFEYSVSSMPFGLWSQIVSEHFQILVNMFPLNLQKDLVDLRFKFMKAYTRNKIEKSLKEFQKMKSQSSPQNKEEAKYQVFSTQASNSDNTFLTEDEYTEIVVSDILNTPFHEFSGQLFTSKSKKMILSFMSHFKQHDSEVIAAFNC